MKLKVDTSTAAARWLTAETASLSIYSELKEEKGAKDKGQKRRRARLCFLHRVEARRLLAKLSDALQSYLGALPEYSNARAQFFYSSLPPRKQVNPTGYNGAITWWRTTLAALVSKGLLGDDKLILVADDDLREKLRWNQIGRPLSLGAVITEQSKAGAYVALDRYQSSGAGAAGTSSWLSLLTQPLSWAASRAFNSSDSAEGVDEVEFQARKGDWVIVELVERAAATVILKLPDLHADALSRLYTLKTFQAKLGSLCLPGVTLSLRDCAVLAKYLSMKQLCVVQGEVIKFAPPLSSSAQSLTITESDRGILTLTATLSSLETYIASIEARIAAEQAQAVSYNAKKQLTLVKSHIIARKRLESLLEQRVASKDKLSEVLHGIEKATGDEETMSAITLGTKTLRTLISSPSLSLDHIEETTNALSDALADANDINEAVTSAGQLDSSAEDEVDDELKALVESAEREEQGEKDRLALEKKTKDEEEADRQAKIRAEMIEKQQKESVEKEREGEKLRAEERIKEQEREEQVKKTLSGQAAPHEEPDRLQEERRAEPAV